MKHYTTVWEKQQLLKRIFQEKKFKRVLDFGSGDGAFVADLLKYFDEVYCVDTDPEMRRSLRRRFKDNVRVKVGKGSATKLGFKDKWFDLVWASEVLEHQPDFRLVEEWERVAAKWVIITVPNPSGPYWNRCPEHILKYNWQSMERFFKARINFKYELQGFGFCWPAWMRMIILRSWWLKLSQNRPGLAWSWLMIGKRVKQRKH